MSSYVCDYKKLLSFKKHILREWYLTLVSRSGRKWYMWIDYCSSSDMFLVSS